MLLLLLVYLADNADLLLLRFFRDTLDVADVFYLIFFFVKMVGMYCWVGRRHLGRGGKIIYFLTN